ncbi:MAG: hypothetical protein K9J84_07235 [Bacteroidia bacterium]|nr:hypothetical protein [Bacteroidia bacterium]
MRENYYILLELDPSIKDDATINAAINKKQNEWCGNHPTMEQVFKQNRAKLPDIKSVLLNPELREKEAEEAKKVLVAKEQEKNKDLITSGSILVKNGEISENDLKALLKKSKFKDFKEEQALKILKAKIKKEEITYKDDGIQLLDESIMKKIRTDLNIVNKENLFDFLSLTPTSSCTLLIQKANDIYNSSSRNPNKTAEITVTNNLSATCQTYLKDENIKKRYQKSLEFESFSEINELIDLAANDKIIDASEFQSLILKCTEKGIQIDRAEYYISEYCKKKSFALIKAENPEYKKQVQCAVCHHLNDPSANNCGNCASPLKVTCPKSNCNHKANSIDKACTNCGFYLGDMPNAIYLIRDANVELSKGNFGIADKYINEAEIYWPGNLSLLEVKEKINKTNSKSQIIIADIDRLLSERKFATAQIKVNELQSINKSHKNISIYEKQINEHILAADNFCKKAKSETNNVRKLDLFLSALEECADFNEAIIGSSSLPIEPPTGLKITKNKKMIGLQWSAPSSKRALKYRILRKENSKPSGFSDGEILAEIPNLAYEDFGVISGKSYYYSVYSVRGNSFSNVAETQGPIIIAEDIKGLIAISGDSTLSFSWEVSNLVKRIEIFRSENNSNLKHGEGQKILSPSKNKYSDSNLINDKEYFYSIYSIFEDCTGKEYISEGVRISSIPSSPPTPVSDLTYSVSNKRVNLKWTNPIKGNVQIMRSQNKINHSIGSVFSFNEVQSLGSFLSNSSNSSAFFDIDFQGQIILTPFTIHNNNAILGKEISLTSIEEVSNIKSQLSGGKLYLEWNWPAGCDLVQIQYSHDGFPNNGNINNPTSINFTKEQYNHNSGYIINQPSNKDYYFTIYTCSKVSGKDFLSNGVNELVVNSEIINIGYKVIVKRLFSKSAFIELKCKYDITLPEMMVVLKYSGIPLKKNDGTCIMNVNIKISNGCAKIEIPFNQVAKEKYIKLFFVDDNINKKFQLQMPKKEELELN